MWWKITLFNGTFTHILASNVVQAVLRSQCDREDIESVAYDKEFGN